jgi:hypothetical protein
MRLVRNRGKGGAVKRGMLAGRGKQVRRILLSSFFFFLLLSSSFFSC